MELNYSAEPTISEFHLERALYEVRYLAGPFGSGKSTGAIMDLLTISMSQAPDSEGIRRTRHALIRQTYPELKSTTIKTFERWVPPNLAPVIYSIPYQSTFKKALHDGTTMKAEFIFLAMETEEDVKKLLSLDLTCGFINEARETPWAIVENLQGRVGRYPETIKDAAGRTTFGPTYSGIILDSNPPRNTHWLYEKFETGATPKGWKKYQQPPAVYKDEDTDKWVPNPDAENLSHLPDGYYDKMIVSGTDDFLRVNLGGEFGMTRIGKPVWPKYNERKHVAKEKLQPILGLHLILALDFGLTPGALIMQCTSQGLRVYDEFPAEDMALDEFLSDTIVPVLNTKYKRYKVNGTGDPAGAQRSRLNKKTDFSVLREFNIIAEPAFTNDIGERIKCVAWFLSRDEGLLIDPSLTFLREAMGGGYVLKEVKNNAGVYSDTPLKNKYSHIADALEYGALFAKFGVRPRGRVIQDSKDKKPFLYA